MYILTSGENFANLGKLKRGLEDDDLLNLGPQSQVIIWLRCLGKCNFEFYLWQRKNKTKISSPAAPPTLKIEQKAVISYFWFIQKI